MPTKRYLVSGRVQGVFFRASAKLEAERLGLRGYARNLADGRVEVLAAGEPAALTALARWLRQGPPQAKVAAVAETSADEAPPAGFETR
jgi:acylphosphatase